MAYAHAGKFQPLAGRLPRKLLPLVLLAATVTASVAAPVLADDGSTARSDLNLNELLDLDLKALTNLKVFSATRSVTDAKQAPAVMTVVTADQIERQGLKTLRDVLERVPGFFFNTASQFEHVGSNGITQYLDGYVILVDGHSTNNRSYFGMNTNFVFPDLSEVQRIEIIRGVGSVMWGSYAGMAVINIITKSGRTIDVGGNPAGTAQVSFDYETGQDRKAGSALYGKKFDHGDLMISAKGFASDGPTGTGYSAGAAGPTPNGKGNANWNFAPSRDVYVKGSLGDFGLKIQHSDHEFGSSENGYFNHDTYIRDWAEMTYAARLGDIASLEVRAFFNQYEDIYRNFNSGSDLSDRYRRMSGPGVETVLHLENDRHRALVGVSAESYVLSAPNVHSDPAAATLQGLPTSRENNQALFVEETYKATPDWQFTAGARLEHDLVGSGVHSTNVMPLAAVVHTFDSDWSAKYAYSEAKVSPTYWMSKNGGSANASVAGSINLGATDTQVYRTHQLQLHYQDTSDGRTSGALTLFHINTSNMVGLAYKPVASGFQVEFNMPPATSQGIQLELERRVTDIVTVYGNYTFNHATFDRRFANVAGATVDLGTSVATADLRFVGAPDNLWNLGTNVDLADGVLLNLHYRGYSGMTAVWTTAPTYHTLAPQHFFDANLLWRNVADRRIDVSLYVKNLLNNQPLVPDTAGGYTDSVLGRRLGATLTCRF